jgi:hypothetical protein
MRYLGKSYNYILYDPVANYKMFESMVEEGYNIEVFATVVSPQMVFLPQSIIISDIRSTLDDESVLKDNYYQWVWAKQVEAISIKFKIPKNKKYIDQDYMIPTGKQFIQPFRWKHSRETRIFHFDRGATYRISIKEHYRKYHYLNNVYRWLGYACQDCDYAMKLFAKIELPIQASTIVPRMLNTIYYEEAGYKKLKYSADYERTMHEFVVAKDDYSQADMIVPKLVVHNHKKKFGDKKVK